MTNLHQKTILRYNIALIRKGEVVSKSAFRDNMITDAGLNKYASENGWLSCLNNPIVGDSVSPNPITRSSGVTTFTQSGTTITASASFFQSGDTGRLFKYGALGTSNGLEVYLTYVNATTATASISATVSTPEAGTVWYVNISALVAPVAGLTWSKNNNASENFVSAGTVGAICTVTHQTVFYSSAFSANLTLTEIAFNDSSVNSNVFDRDLISPPVAVLIGDQAVVTVQLIIEYSPITPSAVGNVGTGYDSSGDIQIESLGLTQNGLGIQYFNSAGSIVQSTGSMEASQATSCTAFLSTFSFVTFNANSGTSRTATFNTSATLQTYGTGNFYRDTVYVFDASSFNSTVYGLGWGANYNNAFGYVTQKFTTPFTKSNLQTLTLTFRKSWQRVLTN